MAVTAYAAASPVEYDGAVAAARTRGIAARMTDGEARHSALGAASAGAKLVGSCAHRGQVATIYFQLVSSSCPACVCVYSLHSSYGRSISVLLLEKKASPVRRADAPATPPRDHFSVDPF